ncbi:MAG: DUF1801 domain-containing protein [Phycisphaeraceae bacterium]|nr:DUF1801 domain-containing protein [Phycisphaeraceae bacterium]
MPSKAATVAEYLESLPEDRREALSAVRRVILDNLDSDYAEGMQYGMIGYFVPHGVYPAGYHCDPKQPLPFAGLASQKGHMSLTIMALYGNAAADAAFRKAWIGAGKRLDMGKACIRFKRLEDVPLDVVGETIRKFPAAVYIRTYESAILAMNSRAAAARTAKEATKKTAKKTAKKAAKSVAKKGSKQRQARG